jgi:hypothetical protein
MYAAARYIHHHVAAFDTLFARTNQIDRIRSFMFPSDENITYHLQLAAAAAAAAASCCCGLRCRFTPENALSLIRLAEDICLECLCIFKRAMQEECVAIEAAGWGSFGGRGDGWMMPVTATASALESTATLSDAAAATLVSGWGVTPVVASSLSAAAAARATAAAAVHSSSTPLSATSSDVVLSNTSTVVSPISDDGFDRLKDDNDGDCNMMMVMMTTTAIIQTSSLHLFRLSDICLLQRGYFGPR